MREIKFRGKQIENGEWITGYYGYKDLTDEHFIMVPTFDSHNDNRPQYFTDYLVEKESVGQYPGIKDKNGKEICEGDIMEWDEKEWGGPFREVVKWDYELFSSRKNDWIQFCTIIGNIYENPELLK